MINVTFVTKYTFNMKTNLQNKDNDDKSQKNIRLSITNSLRTEMKRTALDLNLNVTDYDLQCLLLGHKLLKERTHV